MNCRGCGTPTNRDEEPRYDVLNPDADPEHPEEHGPYCADCWPSTYTAQHTPEPTPMPAEIAEQEQTDTPTEEDA